MGLEELRLQLSYKQFNPEELKANISERLINNL